MSPRWGWGGVVWCYNNVTPLGLGWCGMVWCGVTIMSPRWGWGGVVWCGVVLQ